MPAGDSDAPGPRVQWSAVSDPAEWPHALWTTNALSRALSQEASQWAQRALIAEVHAAGTGALAGGTDTPTRSNEVNLERQRRFYEASARFDEQQAQFLRQYEAREAAQQARTRGMFMSGQVDSRWESSNRWWMASDSVAEATQSSLFPEKKKVERWYEKP